ncbi:hypothetical protein PFICI_07952 [Pestalotiopsis fici W106-1]|uniref:FAD-binding PCMH-type domain-containing protein n=1 Tax=Pestalotiopsis fici (strain W106-1 / CGMCC3.15140) TaxID=1229662 RepID=W3X2Q4_PESFW|nr:uncharacterized protein PFICI_07952 [Pestalotiopsis fici W106-1]ETS80423.1 hypothetical protein PFICI_07952 [Pestalotiopsis fici W106-1]
MKFHVVSSLYAVTFVSSATAAPWQSTGNLTCRSMPGDVAWPNENDWQTLNATIGGQLIRGEPLGEPCYGTHIDATACSDIQSRWGYAEEYYNDAINIMSPYWLNDSCNPFLTADGGVCTLGNLASYAINVTDADSVVAGIKFAQERNIRLSIKNTGHDYIGRSSGAGSLALWTHNLKSISFLNYSSEAYTGPAAVIGAGVQFSEAYAAAAEQGLRVTGGYCPSVGLAGGYVQNGGHGLLGSSYGLGADNVLAYEVVTTDGRHLTTSPTENADLHWALSGGGSGNYAVVLSVTIKAHIDGPVAGAALVFGNADPEAFWAAVAAWQKHLLVLDRIHGLSTSATLTSQSFSLNVATLPGGTEDDIRAAMDPFYQELQDLNVTVISNSTTVNPTYFEHFNAYTSYAPDATPPNNVLGGRLVSRSTVQDHTPELVDIFRSILGDTTVPFQAINFNAGNVTHAVSGNAPGSNAVLPAWRDSLYTTNFGILFAQNASRTDLSFYQAKVNTWQDLFKPLTQGAYVNEATFDNPDWKIDYFGENYDELLRIKQKYDPEFSLWQHTAVGADVYWKPSDGGRLCRVQ